MGLRKYIQKRRQVNRILRKLERRKADAIQSIRDTRMRDDARYAVAQSKASQCDSMAAEHIDGIERLAKSVGLAADSGETYILSNNDEARIAAIAIACTVVRYYLRKYDHLRDDQVARIGHLLDDEHA